MRVKISKWGNSLAMRLPKAVLDSSQLREGDELELVVNGDGSLALKRDIPAFDPEALFQQITPENRHGEMSWGGAMGEEAW